MRHVYRYGNIKSIPKWLFFYFIFGRGETMDKNLLVNEKILAFWKKLTEDEKKRVIISFLDKMKKEDREA